MHAALGLGVAVGVLALDEDGGLADAGLVAGLHVLQFHGEAAALGPAVVHAEEHVGPVVRLGAARAGLDGEDGVVAVELAGEERGDLEGVELGDHAGHGLVEFPGVNLELGPAGGFDELDHDVEVLDPLVKGDDRQDGLLQAVELGNVLLRALVVVPEFRIALLGLQGLDLTLLLFAVKETSTGGRRVS